MLSKIFPPESGPIIHSARQNIPLIGDSVQTEVVKSQRLSCACETYKNVENLCIGLDLVTLNVMCVCVSTHEPKWWIFCRFHNFCNFAYLNLINLWKVLFQSLNNSNLYRAIHLKVFKCPFIRYDIWWRPDRVPSTKDNNLYSRCTPNVLAAVFMLFHPLITANKGV